MSLPMQLSQTEPQASLEEWSIRDATEDASVYEKASAHFLVVDGV